MPASLTIELPEELHAQLTRESARVGKTPEALAAEYLSTALANGNDAGLPAWVGAFASGIRDASLRHDEYIGQALYDELGEKGGDGTVR